MRIPTWHVALTAAAAIGLGATGIGLVTAATAAPAPDSNAIRAAASARPDASLPPERQRLGGRAAWGARLLRIGRHVVHIEATLIDRDGALITIWLDHGTVQSVDSGSVTVAASGGGTQTISIDGETIVRVGREDGATGDITAGDEVLVQSRVTGGTALAKRILVVRARSG